MAPRARPPTVVRPSRDARFVLRYSVPCKSSRPGCPWPARAFWSPEVTGGSGCWKAEDTFSFPIKNALVRVTAPVKARGLGPGAGRTSGGWSA